MPRRLKRPSWRHTPSPNRGCPGPLRIVCPTDQPPNTHQALANSGIPTRNDPVEVGMHLLRLAFTQQLIRRRTPKST